MTIASLLIALLATATPSSDAAGEPLLLDFSSATCGPCQQMRPAIEQLIQKGYRVKLVDVEHSPDLAGRYKVTRVPTFIVVDDEGQALARTEGAQPASELARMYLEVKAKLKTSAPEAGAPRVERDDEPAGQQGQDQDDPPDEGGRPAKGPTNPDPWATVVRIKVHGQGSIGFGSGTIIHSTPEESIVLTCAHIFKLEGRQQAHPSKFPRRITVDLFDGKLSGQKPAMVHHIDGETYEGKAIDYDFARDVGLIRIKPGRRLPCSRVVPTHWTPKERMQLTTVGCSEGRDATAWSTVIVKPSMRGLSGNPQYEAIECTTAPKQGRSGGGLYTTDGYLAGVCDFAEPRGNHGLYATPASIRHVLDRNNLQLCYAPVDRKGNDQSQTLLANNRPTRRHRTEPAIARAQSPDRDESNLVTIPPPELLGIESPAAEGSNSGARSSSTRTAVTKSRSSSSWHATPSPQLANRLSEDSRRTERTDLTLGPEFDTDRFGSIPDDPAPGAEAEVEEPAQRPRTQSKASGKWRPVRSPLPELSATPR
jgi:thiol-disulfide isomerase/thioredoxin